MNKGKVVDISPQGNLVASQISQGVFNRNYFAFIFTLLGVAALMGFLVSQQYEVQKELRELKTQYEVTNIYLAKLKKEKE